MTEIRSMAGRLCFDATHVRTVLSWHIMTSFGSKHWSKICVHVCFLASSSQCFSCGHGRHGFMRVSCAGCTAVVFGRQLPNTGRPCDVGLPRVRRHRGPCYLPPDAAGHLHATRFDARQPMARLQCCVVHLRQCTHQRQRFPKVLWARNCLAWPCSPEI